MSIYSTMRTLATTVIASAAFMATVCGAQTTTVNGVSCSANAVTVTYSSGALSISTGGCGTTPVTPPTSPPTINSVSPSSGAPSDSITINGSNLSGATVKIGVLTAPVLTNSSTQIVVQVPTAAPVNSAAGITVTTSISPEATFSFGVTAAPVTPVPVAPVISTLSPLSGPIGTVLTIAGSGFVAGAGVTIGGVAATNTTITATTITATVPAGAPAGVVNITVTTPSGNSSKNFTVTAVVPPIAGADVSIDGVTLPTISKQPNIPANIHNGMNGAGPEMNGYAMDPARCVATPALTHSWQHNVVTDYKSIDFIAMGAGQAFTYKFTTGSNEPIGGGYAFADSAQSGGNIRPAYMTLTTTPCDFDTSKVLTNTSGTGCYVSGINGVTVNWAIYSGPLPVSYCKLQKNTTYYLNIRFQDVRPNGSITTDSCQNGAVCGGILQVF